MTVTNQESSQSLKGQDVTVTLNSLDALTYLSNISKGQVATVVSSSYTGNISLVDYKGNSFKITPTMPNSNLSSSTTNGILSALETILIV